jgi:hypothetical protein
MEPNEEFVGVAELESGGGWSLLANSPGHVGLFDCDRDTTDTIRVRSKAKMFCGNRGGFDEPDGCWNKAPGPSRVSFVSGGHSQPITPTVVGLFSRAPRGAGGANKTDASMRRLPSAVPHLLFGERPRA